MSFSIIKMYFTIIVYWTLMDYWISLEYVWTILQIINVDILITIILKSP